MEGIVSIVAAEDIEEHSLVTLDGNGEAKKTTAAGDNVFGVTQGGDVKTGEEVAVRTRGATQCRMDGTGTNLAVEDKLMPGADGKAVAHDGAGGSKFVGEVIVIQDGTADGEIGQCRLYADRTQAS